MSISILNSQVNRNFVLLIGHKAHDVFSAARERAASDHMKASASELLMVFPIVRHFALTVIRPTGRLALETKSLCALCALLDIYVAAKRGSRSDAMGKTTSFIEAHKVVFEVPAPWNCPSWFVSGHIFPL